LIDLAGSERSDKLGSKGKALTEGNNINKSLTVLGRVITALVKKENAKAVKGSGKSPPSLVPYRESLLTSYLRESFGGNSRTTMLAACSPVASNIDETISTLRYASEAKKLKTKAKKNSVLSPLDMQMELDRLGKIREMIAAKDGDVDDVVARVDALMRNKKLLEVGGFEKSKRESIEERRSLKSGSSNLPSYPLLSVLNYDVLLSHKLQIPFSNQFPFTIGSDAKASFPLNGIGIMPEHCSFSRTGEVIRITPHGISELYVNGKHVENLSVGVPLTHLDRIMLGPSRLLCLFLAEPLSNVGGNQGFTSDELFNEVISNAIPQSLLPPVRQGIAEVLTGFETKVLAQANGIANLMEVPLIFQCQLALGGSVDFHTPGVSLDNFLERNKTKILVSCVSKHSISIVDVEEDAAWESISKTLSAPPARNGAQNPKKLQRRRSFSVNDTVALDVVSSPALQSAPAAQCLFDLSMEQFEVLFDELMMAEDSMTELLDTIRDKPGKVKDVFFGLLTGKETITHEGLFKALAEVGIDAIDAHQDLYEDGILSKSVIDFESFAKFVFKRPQQVFYRCVASVVTNHALFRALGGRDSISRERKMIDIAAENQRLLQQIKKLTQVPGEVPTGDTSMPLESLGTGRLAADDDQSSVTSSQLGTSMDDVDIFQSIYHLGLTQSSSSVASMSSTSSSRDSRAGSFASPASTPSSRASSCSSEKHRPPRRRPIKQMVR